MSEDTVQTCSNATVEVIGDLDIKETQISEVVNEVENVLVNEVANVHISDNFGKTENTSLHGEIIGEQTIRTCDEKVSEVANTDTKFSNSRKFETGDNEPNTSKTADSDEHVVFCDSSDLKAYTESNDISKNNKSCFEEDKESCDEDKESCDENNGGVGNTNDTNISDESGTDDEYESAEEGEEIQADDQALKELEEKLTEEQKEGRRQSAQVLKEEGNTFFQAGSYKSAIRTYSRALRNCPLKYVKERAVMYANRAACKMRMEEYEDSIRDCTKALSLEPNYMKALMRRAEMYEKTNKLDEALVDYQKIVELDPSQYKARAACMSLPDQIKERNDKLKEEMMGKLKELGNMVLRPFGLSTKNFNVQQDSKTGGYSVQFVQNPGQQ